MDLREVTDDLTPEHKQLVEVRDTHIGKGLFAVRPYPSQAVIGQIRGEMIHSKTYGSSYAFEFDDGVMLEPAEPFRFVNHSCDPNCEFDLIEDPHFSSDDPNAKAIQRLYLITLQPIETGDEFTIDYNWSAKHAIRCECGAVQCRGWVVSEDELSDITES